MVELLLDLGISVSDLYRTDSSGFSYWSSLITIICSGSLLSSATSSKQNSNSLVDLICLVDWLKYEKIILQLIKVGLDINHKDDSGTFALLIASREGHTKLVECLLDSGRAYINQQDRDGESSLMMASAGGFTSICHLLLHYQAKVDLQDNRGWSALMFAVAGGRIDLVVKLLEDGAKVNLQDTCGNSPLMLSCFTGHVEVTKILLAHDADVNHQNEKGTTPLMMSGYNGHVKIVELLIKYQADVDIVNTIGKSALNFSTDEGHSRVIELLIEHTARERASGKKRTLSMRGDSINITHCFCISKLEERMDRIEQVLQSLVSHLIGENQNMITGAIAAGEHYQLDTKPTLREACGLLNTIADHHQYACKIRRT